MTGDLGQPPDETAGEDVGAPSIGDTPPGGRSDRSETAVTQDSDEKIGPWWRRIDKGLVLLTLVVAIGATFVARGLLVGVTGDERANLPEAIEEVSPVPEAVQALNQTGVFVDLQFGFYGELEIDGVAIETVNVQDLNRPEVEPGQQVDLPAVTIYESGNATMTFTPSASAPITEFVSGEHRVVLRYWLIEEGPQRARTFTWTFNVV